MTTETKESVIALFDQHMKNRGSVGDAARELDAAKYAREKAAEAFDAASHAVTAAERLLAEARERYAQSHRLLQTGVNNDYDEICQEGAVPA